MNLRSLPSIEAFLAGFFALCYAYFFIVAQNVLLYSLFLLLFGLFALKVIVALYNRLEDEDKYLARVALVLGVIGTAGAAVHGGYDLANAINAPTALNLDLPNQIDPRGLLAFGFTGLATVKFAWLMTRNSYFPKWLPVVGGISGVLLMVIYAARLIVLDPMNPVLLYPVLLNGFILGPLWYLWIGVALRKK